MLKNNSNDINDYPDSDLLYPGRYVTCGDILATGRPVMLTIARIEPRHELAKQKNRPAEWKPCLFFREVPKGLVLNKTNTKRISKAVGRDPRQWIDKRIVLFVDHEVESFGKIVDGLRVDEAATVRANRTKPAAKPQQNEPDDEAALAAAAFDAEQQSNDQ